MKKYILPALTFFLLSISSGVFARNPLITNNETPALKKKTGFDFIENKGQWNMQAKYKAEIHSGSMFITDKGFVYNFISEQDLEKFHEEGENSNTPVTGVIHYHAYKINFVNARRDISYQPMEKRSNYNNYFIGNDASKWAGHVGIFGKIRQKNIYDGIDLLLYSKGNTLKYDFIIAPEANPSAIQLSFEGVNPQLTKDGNLRIKTTVNEVTEKAPYCYQEINGKKMEVKSRFLLKDGILSFVFPEDYDHAYPLVIDPDVVFATFSGSTSSTFYAHSTTYDNDGNTYTAALAYGSGWPTTMGAYQQNYPGSYSTAINKYNTDGSALIFSTYFGASGSGNPLPNTMRVNDNNELAIAGSVSNANMPVTTGCYQSVMHGSSDVYVARFSQDGSTLLASTYIGGSSTEASLMGSSSVYSGNAAQNNPINPTDIAFDASGNVWCTSNSGSTDFPVTTNAYQSTLGGSHDVVLFKLSPDLTNLLYSTYIGGSSWDGGVGLEYNSNTNAIGLVGYTASNDFPTTSGAYKTTQPGGVDGFALLMDNTTYSLSASTYLGTTSEDIAMRLSFEEANNNFYVAGRTEGNYPITDTTGSVANGYVFIDKLAPDLSNSLGSTRTGANNNSIVPSAMMVDMCGHILVCTIVNNSFQNNMPLTQDAFETSPRGFYFVAFKPNFNGLLFGSYFGASSSTDHFHPGVARIDPNGIIYQSVCYVGNGSSWPTTANSYAPVKGNGSTNDNVTFKFNFDATGVKSHIELPSMENDTVCAPYTLQFDNNSTSPYDISYLWNFDDGATSTAITPSHTFSIPGVYDVVLHAHSDSACINDSYDTLRITVLQTTLPDIAVNDTIVCSGVQSIDLNVTINNPSPNNIIQWGPQAGLLSPGDQPTVSVNPAASSVYYVVVKDTIPGICGFSSSDTVHVDYSPRNLNIITNDTVVCEGSQVQVVAEATPGFDFAWAPSTGVDDTTALNPVITVNQPLTYTLTATHEGCPDTAQTLTIGMQYIPHIQLGPDMEVCQWAPVSLASNVSPFRTDYIYQWTPPGALQNADGANAEFIADTSAMYYFHVATPIGCSANDSIHVTVFPGNFGDASIDTGYCPPASVQLWASGGSGYQWVPDYGLSDANIANPVATPGTSTDYTVYITDIHGCRDTQQVSIQVYPLAILQMPDSVTVYPGESYHLQPSTNALYFNWFPPSGISDTRSSNPEFNPSVRTRYFVTATTEHGCAVSDSIDVLVDGTVIDMPNAFTPTGGNTFKPVKRGIAKLIDFSIYNRWGNKVFSSSNIDQGWDGTFNDTPQPTGVYVYSIEAVTNDGRTFKQNGNVTLIR